uniref:Uncharacterized protein n=1 Tax=Globisporangium ultimum (strain ATCC 200006 / CBS 805.95 / DAOM BR144) TaxID=431595 RepID=K3W6C8_GLOUD
PETEKCQTFPQFCSSLYYQATVKEFVPFALGYSINGDGQSRLGKGSNDNPMLVGVSTKALLARL